MTDRGQSNENPSGRGIDADATQPPEENAKGQDVMHGRSFAGANIANTEREQTRDRQRIADQGGEPLDEAGEYVTDAEIEEREKYED
jgi:hypothetical protein